MGKLTDTDSLNPHDGKGTGEIFFESHPCFNVEAKNKYVRVHLPVAPKCNIQCNYCKRDFDCVNESRPGVTSQVLSPEQALAYLIKLKEKMPNLSVVGIAGPGDPFANPEETLTTLRLVRQHFPNMILCLSSNGLNMGTYADELAEIGVTHVTITMNGLNPEDTQHIYKWVRYNNRVYLGKAAAALLLENQLFAIKMLRRFGITVKINTIVVPGVNEHLVEGIAEKAKELGAELMNAIPLYPVVDTPFENMKEPDVFTMREIRGKVAKHLKPMTHCARCRADAVGLLGQDDAEAKKIMSEVINLSVASDENRPFVAVASYEGMLVNQHFRIVEMTGLIDEGLDAIYKGKELRTVKKADVFRCGASCSRRATGC
jgi:nitrogen fixation protein NifB